MLLPLFSIPQPPLLEPCHGVSTASNRWDCLRCDQVNGFLQRHGKPNLSFLKGLGPFVPIPAVVPIDWSVTKSCPKVESSFSSWLDSSISPNQPPKDLPRSTADLQFLQELSLEHIGDFTEKDWEWEVQTKLTMSEWESLNSSETVTSPEQWEAVGHYPATALGQGVFCNRSLNLRAIDAIGYDMDYTLVQYDHEKWEGLAYEKTRELLLADGWPVEHLRFDANLVCRGLIVDKQLGNIVKADRFGFVKLAFHGTERLGHRTMRGIYRFTEIALSEARWEFLNTLFSISEACLYMQLVDLLDAGKIPDVLGYEQLWQRVGVALSRTHIEGTLKREITSHPEQFLVLDAETPQVLLDQLHAGKKLMLITNSDWAYSNAMMSYAFDRFLPVGMRWRDLFHFVVVSARKPEFFDSRSTPAYQIVDDVSGVMVSCSGPLQAGQIYVGGNASLVEKSLGVGGNKILYFGDHLFGDVNVTKRRLRWRTGLIVREFEAELRTLDAASSFHTLSQRLRSEKERLEHQYSLLRLAHQRQRFARASDFDAGDIASNETVSSGDAIDSDWRIQQLRERLFDIDDAIATLVAMEGREFNVRWGSLMRAGNEKSHLTRQIERYADIYTSAVSNLLEYTPFKYFRPLRSSLPHDPVYYPHPAADAHEDASPNGIALPVSMLDIGTTGAPHLNEFNTDSDGWPIPDDM